MSPQPSKDETPQRLEAAFRIGSMTTVGVLAAFSLTFLTTWAALPGRWKFYDLFGLGFMIVGTALQLIAIALLLRPESLERPRYENGIRWFLIGLALVMVGITISLVGDAVTFLATNAG
jgi:hypothetical protein